MKLNICLMLACLFSIGAEAADGPETINLPPAIRFQFFANMRDHLLAVSEIQAALGEGKFEQAADIASSRLGLNASSSAACRMQKPGMSHPLSHKDNSSLAKFMPPEMHEIGFKMHSAADKFALDARNAAANRDYPAALSSLANITRQCVACHAHFRIARGM